MREVKQLKNILKAGTRLLFSSAKLFRCIFTFKCNIIHDIKPLWRSYKSAGGNELEMMLVVCIAMYV